MKYIAIIDTDDFEDFGFFEDGNGKYLVTKDANAKNDEWIPLYFTECEQEPKTGHCKDCKWWKDKDGVFRRGIDAESKCPINRIEVYEGNGYCFLYEPQERSK